MDKLSRRDFLKLSALTLGSLAAGLKRIAQAEKLLQEIPFTITVLPWDGDFSNMPLGPLNFHNGIDFPGAGKMPSFPPAKQIPVAFNKGKITNELLPPIFITPKYPVKQDQSTEKQQYLNSLAKAAAIPAHAIMAGKFYQEAAARKSPALHAAGNINLAAGLIKAISSTMVKPPGFSQLADWEKLTGQPGVYFPIWRDFSSMRAIIIMKDIWDAFPPEYRQEPFLAFSLSKSDGLEAWAKKDPDIIKQILLTDQKYWGTIVQTAIHAGYSIDGVFTCAVTDVSTGKSLDYTLNDSQFIKHLSEKLAGRLPQPPLPGTVNA